MSHDDQNTLNWLNMVLIYIPVFGVVVGGFIATGWSVKRLKSTIVDATFELRWLLIKQQIVIIACFTINYILQGVNWSILFFFNAGRSDLFFNIFSFSKKFFTIFLFLVLMSHDHQLVGHKQSQIEPVSDDGLLRHRSGVRRH